MGSGQGMTTMEDLFRSYWWLIFPLSWFVSSGFHSVLNYRRQQETLKLIRSYAEKGQEPPEALLKVLDQPIDGRRDRDDYRGRRDRWNDGHWFSVVLFGVMAVGFGYGAYTDMYGSQEGLVIVTFVLAALCLASLVSAMRGGRSRD
jgi:hypothetical protein